MSFLKAGGDGVYNIPALNASSQLYIRGKPFQQYLDEIVGGFSEAEIVELKKLTNYLNVDGLTGEWIVNNANRNQLILQIIDKLNTSGLTTTWVITDQNKNSVLLGVIQELETLTGTHTILLGTIGATVSATSVSVGVLNTQVTTNTASIGALQGAVGANTANIATVTSGLAAVVATALALGATVTALSTDYNGTKAQVATNTSGVQAVTQNVFAINTRLMNYEATVTQSQTVATRTADLEQWQWQSHNMAGYRSGRGFACAVTGGDQDGNGLFVYPNGSNYGQAQIRIETENGKQLYMRGGSATLIYGGADGDILNRNLVDIGDIADNIKIGRSANGFKFPLIQIGSNDGLNSTTQMLGRWYFSTGISIYNGLVTASGIAGPENGKLSTTTSPFLSGLSVLAPVGTVDIITLVGAITLTALAGGIIAQTGAGAISYSTGAGACTFQTGAGAVAIQSGSGVVNISSGSGKVNVTTIDNDIFIGAGKGGLGGAGNLILRAVNKIQIQSDEAVEIDKVGYVEMNNVTAPATTTRKLYSVSDNLFYNGAQLNNQTNGFLVKALTAGTNISISEASGNFTITATTPTPTLASVMTQGATANTNLNMATNSIVNVGSLNVTTINPTNITGWDVKALTAGTGVTLSNTSGNFTINATAANQTLAQVLLAGSSAGSTSLNMNAQNITNVNTITASTVTPTTITGWNVKDITAGSNITLSNTNGNVTISSTGGGGSTAVGGSAGGVVYVLNNPTNQVLTAGSYTVPSLTMTSAYTTVGQTSIRLNSFTAGVPYELFRHRGGIPKDTNPTLNGFLEYNPHLLFSGNGSAQIHANASFFADAALSTDQVLIRKSFSAPIGTPNVGIGQSVFTEFILTPLRMFTFQFQTVVIPNINYFGSVVLGLTLEDPDTSTTYYTFQNPVGLGPASSLTQATLTFDAGSLQTITQNMFSLTTRLRFKLILANGSPGSYFNSPGSFNVNNLAYRIPSPATFSTPLYLGTNNRTTVQNGSLPQIVSTSLPIENYDITSFTNPSLDVSLFFTQPSGTTSNHYIQAFFGDGSLSHVHTPINSANITPTIQQVLTQGNNANNSNISNIGVLSASTITCSTLNYTTLNPAIPTPHSIYFANINVSSTGFTALPTTMDMSKYDYILDFSITGLDPNNWLYLRFNNDNSGSLIAWDSSLIFNPNSSAQGTVNIASATYTNSAFGNSIYWLNGGGGVSNLMQLKVTYKISAITASTFVVSLNQCQPVSITSLNNTAPYYQVFASQIKYSYSNNNATRWSPSHIGIFTSGTAFSNLNCCITQCIRSTVAITH